MRLFICAFCSFDEASPAVTLDLKRQLLYLFSLICPVFRLSTLYCVCTLCTYRERSTKVTLRKQE